MSARRCFLFLLLLAPLAPAAAPPIESPTAHGDRVRDDYFARQAQKLGEEALAEVRTKADWDRVRPRLRREFLDMMGLWPLPARSRLEATITGTIETKTYRVEKLHFQSRPGLYVSANLYLPKKVVAPCPAVLYVCGHGAVIRDGVSFGNKVTYQHHAAWYAENGYACLVLDTLQLGEIQGLHHGTNHLGMWWWASRGYTPAGVELWNAIRGIDYLESRPEVDRKRIGVTGRSGGGATSWWVGAADDRVSCIVPVAGLADLTAHVHEGYPGRFADGVVAGHCDCMYHLNTYRWDYTLVMALCAPRPLLLGNSDRDDIFPVPGYRRPAEKVKKLYALLGAADRFALLETKGPHEDTPALRLGEFRWMNRWLKGDTSPITDTTRPRLTPQQLKVFDRPPADAINDVVHERFRPLARFELPQSPEVTREWWKGKAAELRHGLLDRTFRGWPAKPPALVVRPAGEARQDGILLRGYDFTSEEGVPLRLFVAQAEGVQPTEVIANVVDEEEWGRWLADLGPAFRELLHGGVNPAPRPYPDHSAKRFTQLLRTMRAYRLAYAIVAPRGVGPTRWSESSRFDGKPVGQHIRRRFLILGQTLEGQQVWDVRRAIACLGSVADLKKATLSLQGKGESAAIALYAGLFEPGVASFDLWHPPSSHRRGPTLLNVLTILDMPQAVALALPRPVRLHVESDRAKEWEWTEQLQAVLGGKAIRLLVE